MLENLRRGNSQYSSIISYVRNTVSKIGLSLADIGTSEEEFVRLKRKGQIIMANYWLEQLPNTIKYSHCIALVGYICDEIIEGDLSFVEVGTSVKELVSFILVKAQN